MSGYVSWVQVQEITWKVSRYNAQLKISASKDSNKSVSTENNSQDWANGSVGKMPVSQVWEPELGYPEATKSQTCAHLSPQSCRQIGGRDRYTPRSLRLEACFNKRPVSKEVGDAGQHLGLTSYLHMHGMDPILTEVFSRLTSSETDQSCGPLYYTYLEEINVISVYSANGQK